MHVYTDIGMECYSGPWPLNTSIPMPMCTSIQDAVANVIWYMWPDFGKPTIYTQMK